MPNETATQAHILLAEDNPGDVYLIRDSLVQHNITHQLQIARDGKEALSFLRREGAFADAAPPVLILLDLNLPQHDGTEILRHVRQDRELSEVPVIIFTSSDSPADRLSATRIGVTRYIRKPSLLDEFMAIGNVIQEVLSTHSISARKC